MPREIFNATRSAIRTTTTFAEKELEKRMAEATDIPTKAFRVVRVHSKASDDSGSVWFGFNQIKAKFVGDMLKAYETKDGVVNGSYFFKKAFIASFNGGSSNIFVRSSSLRSYEDKNGKLRYMHPLMTEYVYLPHSIEISADVSELAQQELMTRFSTKLWGYIERRESAA
jgi:hypothetical protein